MRKKIRTFWSWLKKDKRKLYLGIFALALLVIGIVAGVKRTSDEVQYQTTNIEKGTIVSSISASGSVLTSSILAINTQASGYVKAVYVKDGDYVYSGQKIAEITLDAEGQKQNSSNWASYLSAKSGVENANISYYSLQSAMFAANQKFINDAAARSLATDDPTYIQQYADWKAAELKFNNNENTLNQAKFSLTSAWLTYRLTAPTVYAPYSGEITNIGLVEGMVIGGTSDSTASSQRVAVIKTKSSPIVSVTLSEIDVAKVKVGQKATVTFDSIEDKTFTGKVATVDKIGSVATNVTSYSANIKLDSATEEILPNMATVANIILDSKSGVLLVPSGAITTQNELTYARVLRNGQEELVEVTTGLSSDTQIEISSGLNEGDVVITGTIGNGASTETQTRSVFGSFGGAGQIRMAR